MGASKGLGKDRAYAQSSSISGQLILENGAVFKGISIGAKKSAIGEVCFNTSMTGYQEIISDPSYSGQIINFTFPHIGNVGTNLEDNETLKPFVSGVIISCDISEPSNYRSIKHLDLWLKKNNIPGLCNIDTRSITNLIRKKGPLKGSINTDDVRKNSIKKKLNEINSWPGLNGLDLAKNVSCRKIFKWKPKKNIHKLKIVAIDYGIKHNILNSLQKLNTEIIIVPASTSSKKILEFSPDGIFLSNGPGDPKATGKYAIPIIKDLIKTNIPIFGICLGHQIIALAFGAKTKKMFQGHRGANHPVINMLNQKVEITSQNHGFVVTETSIPNSLAITHKSLFDGSIEGIKHKRKDIFSVQYHPEASPGPHDSHYLFKEFIKMINKSKKNA
jgi:carbamoyl-phosphate synthase small subunit